MRIGGLFDTKLAAQLLGEPASDWVRWWRSISARAGQEAPARGLGAAAAAAGNAVVCGGGHAPPAGAAGPAEGGAGSAGRLHWARRSSAARGHAVGASDRRRRLPAHQEHAGPHAAPDGSAARTARVAGGPGRAARRRHVPGRRQRRPDRVARALPRRTARAGRRRRACPAASRSGTAPRHARRVARAGPGGVGAAARERGPRRPPPDPEFEDWWNG
jgi:hypothetical protein